MPNFNKNLKFHFFQLPLVILGLLFVGAITYNNFPGLKEDSSVLGSKSKNTNSSSSSNKQTGSINSAKPAKVSQIKDGVTSAGQSHKNTMSDVVTTLDEVADTEDNYGNTDVSDEVSEVAEDTEETASETVEAIDAVESRPAWKTALLGPDYKNLGQLRSSLAKNTNEIRKLTKAMEGATVMNQEEIQAQLGVLNQERVKIQELVSTNESKFSLLGWVSRLIAGYTPIEDEDSDTEISETDPSTGLEIETTEPEDELDTGSTETESDLGTDPFENL
ncbi:MAG: hypothetical protein WC243_02465 [Patescibacteria group bacterium]|jgi:hypothetical protein